MNITQWAGAFLSEHVSCTSGHDSGPIVNEFLAYCGLPAGNPWCAAFVSYCAHKALFDAGVEEPADSHFKSASSQHIKAWASSAGLLSEDAGDLMNWHGALGGWTDEGDSSHGHVFLIVRRLTDSAGNVVAIGTIEGNSDSAPMDAVNALVRTVPVTEEGHKMWFVNIGRIAGCGYWE
ncbi:MAG TPA: hypothetical protein VGL56_14950 [Fimbriimonadaceae bacterium]|jgi:hypothetical protein